MPTEDKEVEAKLVAFKTAIAEGNAGLDTARDGDEVFAEIEAYINELVAEAESAQAEKTHVDRERYNAR